jgi:hypothetical protein
MEARNQPPATTGVSATLAEFKYDDDYSEEVSRERKLMAHRRVLEYANTIGVN